MNSIQIDKILSSDQYLKGLNYEGVYPRDKIPERTLSTYPCCAVVNTKPHTHPGQHWVCFVKDCDNKGIYFDSYGYPPYNLEEVVQIMESCDSWEFNKVPLQTLYSTVCGQYCVFFLTHIAKGFTLEHIQTLLNDAGDTLANDAFVFSFITNKYHRELSNTDKLSIADTSFW